MRPLQVGASPRANRPLDPGVIRALKRWSPDLLIVTPMIDFTYGQTDYVKAARYLGIPSLLAVASWDNLTNKGLIQMLAGIIGGVSRNNKRREAKNNDALCGFRKPFDRLP